MEAHSENCIEWIRDNKTAALTLSQRSVINRIEHLAAERPDECNIITRNKDGSVFACVPVCWVKIIPTREYTEEQRQIMSERFRDNVLNVESSGNENG